MTYTDDSLDLNQLLTGEFDAQAREIHASATTGPQVRRTARRRLVGLSAVAGVALLVSGALGAGLLMQFPGKDGPDLAVPGASTRPPTGAPVDVAMRRQVDSEGSPASQAQRHDLRDGTVTRAEYLAAFGRLRSCMRASGYDVLYDQWSQENQVIDAGHSDAADASYSSCYPKEFMLVDATWQSWRANFGPDAAAMARCLTKRGKIPDSTVAQKVQQLAAMGLDAYKDCPGVTGEG